MLIPKVSIIRMFHCIALQSVVGLDEFHRGNSFLKVTSHFFDLHLICFHFSLMITSCSSYTYVTPYGEMCMCIYNQNAFEIFTLKIISLHRLAKKP